ncbi:pre-mRNA 3'-end-processing factor FIP1 isoform X2 [Callorhinchus milii]|uniref:pre-mRNA 3'-end-processing factor FIP1 isoform X2 n=1 Tax=Callorhinchus milii TaxID=7868 RepID=UPI0004571E62|nr:pre-mRNA 3'-end-processing factor FIP1 isoform X2 [Callorhinchus milii]|eukprot:gi/632950807/ref/XP_007890938.1/ PREDICTED: pre-mRNA 3'-end-processing factor FIP1 isoform X3 [Callorhinchus milii]
MSAEADTMVPEAGAANAGPGDDEEHWLYGDENDPNKQEEQAPVDSATENAPLPAATVEEPKDNGVARMQPTDEGEEESDSDSDDDDDDVQVTIGDIKTGAPQYTYGVTPVNLNIKSSGRLYGSGIKAGKGVDLDAPGDISGIPTLEIDLDSFEDKPWRKPGADLSDYFNYGFNEETWKAYCEKQKRLRMGLEPLPPSSTTNRITVQQGRTGNPEKEPEIPPPKMDFPSPPNRYRAGPPPNRRLSGSIEVIGGQLITIARVEGRRRDRGGADENAIQVLGDHGAVEFVNSNNPTKRPPFLPPGAPPLHMTGPPPPFLPPPPPVSATPPLLHPPGMPLTTPPPGFLPPPGAPPPSLVQLESGAPPYNNRAAPPFGYSTNAGCVMSVFHKPDGDHLQPDQMFGFQLFRDYGNLTYPNIPVSSSWTTLIDNNNKQPQQQPQHWDYYPRRERERERERDRTRERDRDRDRERERDHERERDRSPSSSAYNGEEGRYRHRDYQSDKVYDRDYHHRDKVSREKEDRHKERRHRDKEEGRHKSSRSSRRRHDSEEVDGHKRHKHKKSKRSKEDKEASEERSQEPEPSEAASSN